MLSELLALQVMLPNQVIFGFHRGAERGWRGADLWETPPTKDLEAWLYLGFRPAALTPVCHKQANPRGLQDQKQVMGLLAGVWLNAEPAQEQGLSPWGALSWD